MAEIGSDVWRPPCPLLKQSHLELVSQACVLGKMTLEYLQEWKTPQPLWEAEAYVGPPLSEKMIFYVQRDLPVFLWVSIASCAVTGYHWKEPILSAPSFHVFVYIGKIPHLHR